MVARAQRRVGLREQRLLAQAVLRIRRVRGRRGIRARPRRRRSPARAGARRSAGRPRAPTARRPALPRRARSPSAARRPPGARARRSPARSGSRARSYSSTRGASTSFRSAVRTAASGAHPYPSHGCWLSAYAGGTSCFRPDSSGRRLTPSVSGSAGASSEVEHGRRDVDEAHGRGALARRDAAGRVDDERHQERRVVDEEPVRVLAVRAEALAVIAGQHGDGGPLPRGETLAQHADRLVDRTHLPVVRAARPRRRGSARAARTGRAGRSSARTGRTAGRRAPAPSAARPRWCRPRTAPAIRRRGSARRRRTRRTRARTRTAPAAGSR